MFRLLKIPGFVITIPYIPYIPSIPSTLRFFMFILPSPEMKKIQNFYTRRPLLTALFNKHRGHLFETGGFTDNTPYI